MREKIIKDLLQRLGNEISDRSKLAYLKKVAVADLMDIVTDVVYMYTRDKRGVTKNTFFMVEIISAIGHAVRNELKMKKDSSLAAKTGAFFLFSFQKAGMITVRLGQGASGHGTYIVEVLDDDALSKIWNRVTKGTGAKLPALEPYAPWTTVKHPTGARLVKTGVSLYITAETHPIVFHCVNVAQEIGWNINKPVFDLHLWALRNKTDAFAEIWELHNPEAKATKLREAKAIGEIAKKFLSKTFYHMYTFDFRGRKYPNTAYLHEQGSDLARGMLMRADKKAIGHSGYFWLLVSIASTWAGDSGRPDGAKTDKIPLTERAEWVLDNEEIILSYADSPKVNQGWMKADKPWQFIAACFELKKLRIHQYHLDDFEDYTYESHLECYIDGSNNGSQHLSALTRDEVTAPHVNLVPQEMPGDLYKYVAEFVWEALEKAASNFSREERKNIEGVIDTLIDMKRQITHAEPRSERRKELVQELQEFKKANGETLVNAACIYWLRIKDAKQRRKVVKRNIMTLPL